MFGFSSMSSSPTRWSGSSLKTACSVMDVTTKDVARSCRPVHQHLGLDDGHEVGLLRERREPSERVCVHENAVLARDAVSDRDHGAPLREARAELAVLLEPLAETVEALSDLLVRRAGEPLRAGVHLDPRDDPLALEQLRERRAVRRALADRLVVEDHARDVVARALRREEEVAVGAPRLLGRLDSDRVEAAS